MIPEELTQKVYNSRKTAVSLKIVQLSIGMQPYLAKPYISFPCDSAIRLDRRCIFTYLILRYKDDLRK